MLVSSDPYKSLVDNVLAAVAVFGVVVCAGPKLPPGSCDTIEFDCNSVT